MPRPKRSNPKTKHRAIQLRKKSTPAERKLWSRIRDDQLGVTFRRQQAVGNYIPDLPWHRPPGRCVVLKPGASSSWMEVSTWSRKYDEARTKYLETFGYKVIPQGRGPCPLLE